LRDTTLMDSAHCSSNDMNAVCVRRKSLRASRQRYAQL